MIPGRVSIITTVYNKEKYLRQCINSSLAQTYKNFEITCINDNSTDGSADILDRYTSGSKIQLSTNPTNIGSAASLNWGIKYSLAEFFLRLDADDWIEPNYLEKTVPLMADPKVGAVCTHVQLEGLRHEIAYCHGATLEGEMQSNLLPGHSLFRKSAFLETPGYNSAAGVYCDWNLWIDLLKRNWKIAVVPEPLVHYRIVPDAEGGESAVARNRHEELYANIRKLHPDLWSNG